MIPLRNFQPKKSDQYTVYPTAKESEPEKADWSDKDQCFYQHGKKVTVHFWTYYDSRDYP